MSVARHQQFEAGAVMLDNGFLSNNGTIKFKADNATDGQATIAIGNTSWGFGFSHRSDDTGQQGSLLWVSGLFSPGFYFGAPTSDSSYDTYFYRSAAATWNLNSCKITGSAVASSGTDLMSQAASDARYVALTSFVGATMGPLITPNQLAAATGAWSLGQAFTATSLTMQTGTAAAGKISGAIAGTDASNQSANWQVFLNSGNTNAAMALLAFRSGGADFVAPGLYLAPSGVDTATDVCFKRSGTNAATIDAPTSTTFTGAIIMTDAKNIQVGTGTGTKIGTATTQKIGFLNATPVAQQANTTDLRTVLINFGFIASGGATPLDLNGGALTTANHTFTDGSNIVVNTGTGTKIGTGTTQKLGMYNATPIAQQTRAGQLTDNSGGTPSATIAAIGATYTQSEVRNAVASLAAKINALDVRLSAAGGGIGITA